MASKEQCGWYKVEIATWKLNKDFRHQRRICAEAAKSPAALQEARERALQAADDLVTAAGAALAP
ncbi:hypothetical protein ACFV9X_13135 [Streptomyces anulatus]|uniref:hypothetical protein n=1 Tax=Streptomyces TaxID=1883 RepID=UPI00093ECBA4|nr:hypothetical protein [Streptomyces sp. TSRI0261]OKJ07658.1 hypothetical protein AMK20_24150 [Streptomyces sp. TSRI0261]